MGSNLKIIANLINQRKPSLNKTIYEMKDNINPDDEGYDPSEEYYKKKGNSNDNETEVYFPQETTKPPHY